MADLHDDQVASQLETWGYYLHDRPHENSPGYAKLLIMVREEADETAAFVPQEMTVRLIGTTGSARELTLRLTPDVHDQTEVCLGRIALRAHDDEQVEFFSFGAILEVLSTESSQTVYRLQSSAPILPLTDDVTPPRTPDQFASETEVAIGELRADLGAEDEAAFACRLLGEDPLEVYVAAIHSISQRLEENESLQDMFPDFYRKIRRERQWLEDSGNWPTSPPSLEQLLQA